MKRISVFIIIALFFTGLSLRAAETQDTAKSEGIVSGVVSWYMDNMSYGSVTLLMAVESSFIPFPSEVVIPPAAYKAATDKDSDMSIPLIVLFGTLGALIGAFVNYFLSVIIGRPIIYKFADSRIGHMLLIDRQKIEKAEDYFRKHGKVSTFVGRFVPAVRQLISIPAGLAKMNKAMFALFTFLGAMVWNAVLALIGYLAKGQQDVIEKYSSELSHVILVLAVLFVAYLVYNGLKGKKKKENAE